MNRLRHRLIAAFLAATILPFAAATWIGTSLLDRSLGYATTGELDRLSRTLEATVRQFYQREREALKQDALAGRTTPTIARRGRHRPMARAGSRVLAQRRGRAVRPLRVRAAIISITCAAPAVKDRSSGVEAFSRDLGGIRMEQLSAELRQTRELVESIEGRDLRRGFTLTLLLLLGAAWLLSLAPLVFIAHRISQPIQQLTAALSATSPPATGRGACRWRAQGKARAMKSARRSTRSTTWPTSCGSSGSGSCT